MKGTICKKCGVEIFEVHDGMCRTCYVTQEENRDADENPDQLKWVAKVAHMGKRRVIEVPKNQRSLINDNDEYIVIIKKK